MAVRPSMSALIQRVRLLVNDPSGVNQTFTDQDFQDILDESRVNVRYLPLAAAPTYTGSTLQYLDYYADFGGFEDSVALFQYLTIPITPTTSENIVGHWTFAQTMYPPVFLNGNAFDVYRSAADILERWAAKWAMAYNVSLDGQSLARSQVMTNMLSLAKAYRMKQRPVTSAMIRSDLLNKGHGTGPDLGPTGKDFYVSGDGR